MHYKVMEITLLIMVNHGKINNKSGFLNLKMDLSMTAGCVLDSFW